MQNTHTKSTRAARLETIRRLDWRFLLPDPRLRRVAYFGPPDDALRYALEGFADFLLVVNGRASDQASQHPFDVAVLNGVSPKTLPDARALLRSNGLLYWEWHLAPLLSFSMNGRQARASELDSGVELLSQHGFAAVSRYWHRPNFDECLEIVPLDDAAALRYFFSQTRSDLKGRLKTAAGRLLHRSGLLKYTLASVSFVARNA